MEQFKYMHVNHHQLIHSSYIPEFCRISKKNRLASEACSALFSAPPKQVLDTRARLEKRKTRVSSFYPHFFNYIIFFYHFS